MLDQSLKPVLCRQYVCVCSNQTILITNCSGKYIELITSQIHHLNPDHLYDVYHIKHWDQIESFSHFRSDSIRFGIEETSPSPPLLENFSNNPVIYFSAPYFYVV